ncbi:MAG: type I secretion system permease/ATPase [Boseongicola sp.]|nr:type I secretion system permease/ATPase [Boseongicola sp.]NNJ67783.1 type I secretion system permease/ATPase [Boseongicola sp.]
MSRATNKDLKAVRSSVRRLGATTFVFSIFTNLLMLTGPLFMLQVYDRVLGSRSEETLVALFALVALLYFLYWLIEFARGRVMVRAGAHFQSALGRPVLRVLLRQAALRRQDKKGSVTDLDAIRGFFAAPVMLAIFDLPWTPLFIAAIFVFHPMLGWLAVAGATVLTTSAVLNQMLTAKRTKTSTRLSGDALRIAKQAEDAAPFLRSQGMTEALIDRWFTVQDSSVDQSLRGTDWTASFSSFSKSFRLFLQSAMLALGAWLVLGDQITAGAMIAASIILGRALAPIEISVSQWPVAQRGWEAWRSVNSLLADERDQGPETTLPRPEAKLDVSNVTLLQGAPSKPILQQVTFAIAPGEAIGVIGRSGSGKTTLAQIIVGLLTPTRGDVRLAGAKLDQYDPEHLGTYIGYLPQDVQLFDGTIAENIARMTANPDPDKVVAAAQKAHVHDIILNLPKGYDTRIGAQDCVLSGGQRQRLALARAIYADPVLLVLDEPNSALDAEGSSALHNVIQTMKAENKGVIIMTHRPNAISACDTLLVLENGRVAAHGPRGDIIQSMMKNSGAIQQVIAKEQAHEKR